MIYKTEFEIAPDVIGMETNLEGRVRWEKERSAANMGLLIGDNIGFEEIPNKGMHLRLEVQAFARKDWEKFKQEVKDHITSSFPEGRATYELKQFSAMINRLESIGYTQPENKINQ
jgi:hypothetical protein